jgi:hypothetical protein
MRSGWGELVWSSDLSSAKIRPAADSVNHRFRSCKRPVAEATGLPYVPLDEALGAVA